MEKDYLSDFFFFITNINSTFPANRASLLRLKTPVLSSLPRLYLLLLGNALEFKLTVTSIFLVERIPALLLGILTCPTALSSYMNLALVASNLKRPKFVFFILTWVVKVMSNEGVEEEALRVWTLMAPNLSFGDFTRITVSANVVITMI